MNHKLIEGDLLAREASYAIVVSRWNELITRRLLEGPEVRHQHEFTRMIRQYENIRKQL